MHKTTRMLAIFLALLAAFVLSCESRQKAEVGKTGESQQTARPLVDASKQIPLQGPYQKENGFAWKATNLTQYMNSSDDMKNTSRSKLVLYEDGKPLGPAHSMHDDIRTKGRGGYSHWSDTLYFSTSDNSDPNKNGKKYTIFVE